MDTNSSDIGLYIVIFAVFGILYLIPSIITSWNLYAKAGQYGWAALIPLYASYVFGIIAKMPVWLIATFIGLEIISNFVEILGFPYFILAIYFLFGFAKQYNAGLLFWVMYIFIPWVSVFMMNKVQYIGEVSGPSKPGSVAPETTATSPVAQPVTTAQASQPAVGFAPKPIEAQQFTPVQTPVQPTAPVAPTAEQTRQEPPTNPQA